jgi:hypothetical protein
MMTLQDFLGRVSSLRFVEGSKFQRQRRSRNGGFCDRFKRVLGTVASCHPRDASNGIKADRMTPVELPPAAD